MFSKIITKNYKEGYYLDNLETLFFLGRSWVVDPWILF